VGNGRKGNAGGELGDRGVFHIYLNEEKIGVVEFDLSSDGSYRGRTTVSVARQHTVFTLDLKTDGSRSWTKVVVGSAIGVMTVRRKGSRAEVTFPGASVNVRVPRGCLVYDALSPALIGQVIGRVVRRRAGPQNVPLFLTVGGCRVATVQSAGVHRRIVKDREVMLECFHLAVAGVRVRVWADATRICFVEAPAYHSVLVRDGYQALLPRLPVDPLLSTPLRLKVDHNVRIPMRDGVELAADIYRPRRAGRRPVILMRTPYGKEMDELSARFYARRGYVVAVQDVRGRFESAGRWEPLVHEGRDGYDAIEWLAVQPWSTGRIGMAGGSYLAWAQWLAAAECPPHLVTIVPAASPTDTHYNLPYEYGVFCQAAILWWMDVRESNASADVSGRMIWLTLTKRYDALQNVGPVIDYDLAILGKRSSGWRRWIEHPPHDPYWRRVAFLESLANVRIPVFHQTGWLDGASIGTRISYQRMVACGHPHQKLVLGPWDHAGRIITVPGDDRGGDVMDLQGATLAWFEHWLKGIDTGILREPRVSVFVLGSNRWLTGDTYPLPETRQETWFLVRRRRFGEHHGELVRGDVPAGTPPSRYSYDPADPTPDLGVVAGEAVTPMSVIAPHKHVATNRKRPDVLVYVSKRFRQPYTIVGPIQMVLSAASSARDTDWHVHLMDERRDGTLMVLAHGKIRARYRQSMTKPQRLTPGRVYAYSIDLWQIGITIAPGSRVRLEIASAAFPTFSRNLNTGGHNEMETRSIPATQRIYHSRGSPSYVVLPVIPDLAACWMSGEPPAAPPRHAPGVPPDPPGALVPFVSRTPRPVRRAAASTARAAP
jgi:putative CocE/NonD family hydrolase